MPSLSPTLKAYTRTSQTSLKSLSTDPPRTDLGSAVGSRMANDSRKFRGRRRVQGARFEIRRVLYKATLRAVSTNAPEIADLRGSVVTAIRQRTLAKLESCVRVVSETQVGGEPMSERARVVGWWVPVDDTHTVGFHLEALRIENGRPVPSSLATAHPGRSTMMGEARTSYEDTQPRSRRSRSTGESTQHRASCSGAQGNNRSRGDHVPQAVAPCAA